MMDVLMQILILVLIKTVGVARIVRVVDRKLIEVNGLLKLMKLMGLIKILKLLNVLNVLNVLKKIVEINEIV